MIDAQKQPIALDESSDTLVGEVDASRMPPADDDRRPTDASTAIRSDSPGHEAANSLERFPLLIAEEPMAMVLVGDCREVLPCLAPESIDCVIADQPFNIGVKYAAWDDNLPWDVFWQFTYAWIDACIRVLKRTGSFWLWLPPRLASRVAVYLEDQGLKLINDIAVIQQFGQCQKGAFISGHVRLLYFAKSREHRSWNPSQILVPSLRASKYKDKRTQMTETPGLRVPLDVWGINEQFFGRVQRNNKERRPLHPNQVPEAVVDRILKATTMANDLVLDPFLGSGTTCTVARALGRQSVGIEFSRQYAESAFERIQNGPVQH